MRLNLDVSEAIQMRLDVVQSRTNATDAVQVLQRALAIYDLLIEARENGDVVLLRSPDGKDREVSLDW